jgi:hypothetical protein
MAMITATTKASAPATARFIHHSFRFNPGDCGDEPIPELLFAAAKKVRLSEGSQIQAAVCEWNFGTDDGRSVTNQPEVKIKRDGFRHFAAR